MLCLSVRPTVSFRVFVLFVLALAVGLLPQAWGQAAGSPIYYPSGPAGTIAPPSGKVAFEIPVERAGHSFTVYANSGPTRPASVVGLITTSGTGATAEMRSLLVAAVATTGSQWWVRDNTARQVSQTYAGPPSGTVSLLSSTWTTQSGVANRYFVVPSTRDGHGLIYGNPAGLGLRCRK